MDHYSKVNNGQEGTVTGRLGELCWVTWDDGTKSKEIKGYLTVIERDGKVVNESLKESVNSDIVSMIKKQFPKATIKTSVRKHSDVHKSNPDTQIGKSKYVNIRITPDSASSVNSILQYCNHNIKKILDSDNRFYYYGDTPARNPRGGKEVIISYEDYSDLSEPITVDYIEESQNTDLHDGSSIADSKEIKTDKGVFTRFGNHWEYKPNTGKVGFSLSDKELEDVLKNHKVLHVESKESIY